MLRQSILPRPMRDRRNPAGAAMTPRRANRLRFGRTLAIAIAIAAAPLPATSQDRSVYERLDRIERDLNMMQRQVYRGAPAPMTGDPGAGMNAELRLDRIETQMRELTGRIEEYTNQTDRLRQRVEQINGDVESRFSQGGPVGGVPSARPGPGGRQPATDTRGGNLGAAESPYDAPGGGSFGPLAGPAPGALPRGTVVPPPSGLPPGSPPGYGTLTPPGTPPGGGRGAPSGGPGGSDLASAAGALPQGSATEQYNHAFGLLKQANYPAAEASLRAFVEQHPSDPMAGNAQYWLGETFYARGRFMEAASAFAEGYKRWPKSTKAPDDLLKLGMSLGRANQKQNACVALGQFDQAFPTAAGNIKQQAAAEKKRLGC